MSGKPWWLKMIAKAVLARVPLGYHAFARLGLFRHGQMDGIDYALGVVRGHVEKAGFSNRIAGAHVLELGPGDSVTSALICHALGAARCYLVDTASFASSDIALYQRQVEELRDYGFDAPNLARCASVDAMLEQLNAVYLTDGLASLRTLPDNSVDLVWSHAVLEHVRLHEFDCVLDEFKRLMKPHAVNSHRVDLQDHLDGSLHNLRFSRKFWERPGVVRSGFYTNRIRYPEMLERFNRAGFEVSISELSRWQSLPVAQTRLDPEFQKFSTADLCVKGFSAVLT